MARIVVVGGGFAGLSAAARLAKLRHDVTVLERDAEPGGLLLGLRLGDERWAAGPQSVTLPGVFRDLFRKSGRPMDALLAISPAGPRRHLLPGGLLRRPAVLDLPFGTRSAQHDAVSGTFGRDAWSPWVDDLAAPWDALRRNVLEAVGDAPLSAATRAALLGDRTIDDLVSGLPRKLRPLARDVRGAEADDPAVLAVWHYVERNFGRWTFDGGDNGLAAALVTRLSERRVPIETGIEVKWAVARAGRVVGVALADGSHRDADIVVWATGEKSSVASRAAIRLEGPPLPDDFVVHTRHFPVHGWRAGADRWLLTARAHVDPVAAAAAGGLDVTDRIVARHDLPGRFPMGSSVPRPVVETDLGEWRVGGAAVPGAGLEVTGMGTAALAAALGPVPR